MARMGPRWRRLLVSTLLVLGMTAVFLLPVFVPPGVADEFDDRLAPRRCWCHRGKATWEYLRSPLKPPEDPARCGLILAGGNCAKRPRPEGVRAGCWGSRKRSCFWKRHAMSWDIDCSACFEDMECDTCDDLLDAGARSRIEKRLAAERETLPEDLVIAVSPHFYVVTNLHKQVKVLTRGGGRRLMTAHEVAHLTAQRCEQAYDDFAHWFTGDIVMSKPMAVFVTATTRDAERIGERYFGKAGIHMNYAFAYNDRICDGVCGNGFVVSAQDQTSDRWIHGFCRHQIGHILFSCWLKTNGFEDHCPRWAWCGAAHFMTKLLDVHEDYATYCYGESDGGTGPRQHWPKRVQALAKKDKMVPIETYFGRNSLSSMRYEDHLRSWSMMDLGLRENRDRWLRMLTQLRDARDEAVAFKDALGLTPEAYHERWVERVMGKRRTMGPDKRAEVADADPLVRELERLASSDDADVLAGRIRGLDVLTDTRAAEAVVGQLGHESDLVRESAHLVLARTADPEVRAYLREDALYDRRWLVRAGVARALGALKDEAGRFRLEQMLGDKNWLCRANAAFALQQIGNRISRRALEAAIDDRHPKAWISICDAFASYPGRSEDATQTILSRLDHRLWQIRLTAVHALGRIGTPLCVEALVGRFREESGRLKADLYWALKAVTGHDVGPRPADWDAWWREQKAEHGGLPPKAEPEAPPSDDPDERYGVPDSPEIDTPHHYGRRFFSRSVCLVLDTSGSMELNMKVPEGAAKALGGLPTEGTRMAIAKHAVRQTLAGLHARTKIRVVFFGTRVRLWKDDLVAATAANVAAAQKAVDRRLPDGETNFHGALKAALGLHEKPTIDPALDPVPDTVFFLTDGRPTRGEIQAMPELTSWLANLNRWAKIRLYVIALGELNVDLPSLHKMAAAADGEVIHVPER